MSGTVTMPRRFKRLVPPTLMEVMMRPNHVTLTYYARTLETLLRACIDDAFELGLPSRLNLYKDVGGAQDARLLDPPSPLSH